MKKSSFLIRFALFILTTISLTACSLMSTGSCDQTIMPEIEVGIKATVHVLDKNRNPIANQQVNLSLYKVPCGAPAKGRFEFDGPTNADGIRSTTTAFYKLRNSEDEVWVDAHAVNLGNGSAQKDSGYATFKYKDFTPGYTMDVDVYIYRDF
jgi:hypothetical protein